MTPTRSLFETYKFGLMSDGWRFKQIQKRRISRNFLEDGLKGSLAISKRIWSLIAMAYIMIKSYCKRFILLA